MGLDILCRDADPGTILTTGKLLFSSGQRKMDIPSTGLRRMENLLTTRRSCPRPRFRRQWRTGEIRS